MIEISQLIQTGREFPARNRAVASRRRPDWISPLQAAMPPVSAMR